MAVLWYQRVESFPAATPPTSVSTTQTAMIGQRRRMVNRASWASRFELGASPPVEADGKAEGVRAPSASMVTPSTATLTPDGAAVRMSL